jgi:hypothetical protein
LELKVKSLKLMAKAFELGKKLNVGHFFVNLIDNLAYLLEYLIQGKQFVSREKFIEEGLIFLSIIKLFGFFMTFRNG